MRTLRQKKRKTESKLGISESGEARTKQSVYDRRKYRVKDVSGAKQISANYLKNIDLDNAIEFGLPEVDDRYHIWRVPLKGRDGHKVGEVVIDAHTSLIQEKKTTQKQVLEARLLGRTNKKKKKEKNLPIDLCISNGMVPHSCFDPDRIPLAMQSSIRSRICVTRLAWEIARSFFRRRPLNPLISSSLLLLTTMRGLNILITFNTTNTCSR